MQPNVDRVADYIREAAAEEIITRFTQLAPEDIAEKQPGDLVTATDLAMERRLSAVLASEMPGSVVFGEEAVALDRALLTMLGGDAPVWVIDPLDGTGNFAAGIPLFAVLVAYIVAGETQAGWIYDPVGGRMATGVRGEGTWMNGRRLSIAKPPELRRLTGSVYGRKFRQSEAYVRLYGGGRGPIGQIFNTRCVGQEYLARLQGGMHFGIYTRLNPWDHAAGCLLHEEAGGHVARFDHSPYKPGLESPGILVAPDIDLWNRLHKELIAPVES